MEDEIAWWPYLIVAWHTTSSEQSTSTDIHTGLFGSSLTRPARTRRMSVFLSGRSKAVRLFPPIPDIRN